MIIRLNIFAVKKFYRIESLVNNYLVGMQLTLKDDLADPDLFKLYDNIIHDPENALDYAKLAKNGELDRLAKSSFFNEYMKLGRQFENKMLEAVLNKTSKLYRELSKKYLIWQIAKF